MGSYATATPLRPPTTMTGLAAAAAAKAAVEAGTVAAGAAGVAGVAAVAVPADASTAAVARDTTRTVFRSSMAAPPGGGTRRSGQVGGGVRSTVRRSCPQQFRNVNHLLRAGNPLSHRRH